MGADHEYSDDPAFLLYRALVTGQKIFYASGDGNANKKTVVCSDLTSVSDQDGNQVHIVDPNSSANGQTRDITGVTTAGTVTVGTAFDVQITEDTAFILTGIRSTPVEVAAFETWVKAAIGDASGHTLTSLVTKWGDITRSLDLMLGARWDTSGDLGTDIANIITAIAAIQNNTRFTAAVPVQMCKPDAGNEAFRMASNLYDTEGNMEDPTNNEILVRVIKDDGTYITADIYKENGLSNGLDNATDGTTFPFASGWRAMEREAEGKFFFFMKVANDATEESLTVEFGWTELTKHNYQSRSTEIADVHGDLAELLADVGNASAATLGSLYDVLGNPSASLATTILDGIDGRTNTKTLNGLLGVPDDSGKTIYTNMGDYQAQTNLQTLLAALGIPDTSGKPLYTCLVTDRLDNATHGLAVIAADTIYIADGALPASPVANSLARFIASGGTALGTSLGASKSIIDAIGADGVDVLSHDFSEAGLMQYAHGKHLTTYILFVIPEAVGSISAHNTAITASLEKLGRVLTITQADALSYPDFNTYTLCVLGSNNGTAWTTSNLAHIKELTDMPVVCCDSVSAAYLEMGTANANVTTTKALFGVANIEGSIVGMGLHDRTGLAVGTQDIADANTTFASLNMSDGDITEVYYGYETSNDNAHVLLGKIRFIQPDGTIGVDEEGEEIPGSRYFYGPAYSFNALNTLGQEALEILVLGLIHSKTIGHSIAISGEIRSLEKVLFGNLKNTFSNSYPLAKYIGTGGVGLGRALPNSTSLVDIIGDYTGPYNGAAQDDNVKASLDLLHTYAGDKSVGKLQIASTTEDLNQGAASYDLFTGTAQDLIIESLLIRMPNIVAGGAITSISIQTDDATPQVLISAADGAVANLTAEAQLAWQNFNAPVLIKTGTKIQLTIAGGAHGIAYVCDVVAKVRAVTSGGYLA